MYVKDSISNEQLECLKAVQRINNELHEKEGWNNHSTLLSITICSYHFFVTLDLNIYETEITLFNSLEDDRIYYEKSDKYEEWYSFFKRKFREIKKDINKIKL